jgi:hypothetical protein
LGDHVEGFEVAVLLDERVRGFGEGVDFVEAIRDVGVDGRFELPVPFLAPFSGYYFADEVGFFEALGIEFFEVALGLR